MTDGGSVSGDRKLKASTPRLPPGTPHPPTMGFNNRAADREAHAHAVGLRRVEGFKETRQAFRAQPMTAVPHRDANTFRCDQLCGDIQFALAPCQIAHRLNGIDHQVEDHLLELDSISLNVWQGLCQLHPRGDAILYHFALDQANNLKDRAVDI